MTEMVFNAIVFFSGFAAGGICVYATIKARKNDSKTSQ